ncbi:MAG: DUF4442 domain-containing protein [Bdellovibrionota bacterium]
MIPDFAKLASHLPPSFRATALLRGFGLLHVPLLLSLRPTVTEITDDQVKVRIPLNRWTRNHLHSMYFGSLAMGADCVVGLMAVHHIRKRNANIQFAFKDFTANFLKRPEGDVLFVCEAGELVAKFVDEVNQSTERKNLSVPCHAVLAKKPDEKVAEFTLTLSLKRGKA